MLFQSFLGIIALFIWGKLVDLLNIQEALLVVCGGPLLAACFWLSQVYIGSEWHDLSTRERLLAYACFAVVALTTFVSVTLPGEWVDEVPWILAVGAAIMPVFCLLAVWAEPVATVH